jgi:hypothetical protein
VNDHDTLKEMLTRADIKFTERYEGEFVVLDIDEGGRCWAVAKFLEGKLHTMEGACW